jgi:hypothetical protein
MTLRHLRHLSSRVNARVAGPSPDVSVLKMRAAPYCASWLYFDVLGHGRYRLLFVWRSVIQMEAIPKEVNLEEYCLSFRTSSLGPLLKGLGVTNVTSPHTKSLWHFVAVLCLCRRERLPTLPSHPPLGASQPSIAPLLSLGALFLGRHKRIFGASGASPTITSGQPQAQLPDGERSGH